jgi:hypothetical protein
LLLCAELVKLFADDLDYVVGLHLEGELHDLAIHDNVMNACSQIPARRRRPVPSICVI